MRKIKLGSQHSLETRKKMSAVKLAENNPFFGLIHSEETRKKMSEAKKGINHPFFGKTHNEETKDKISRAQGITIYVYSLDSVNRPEQLLYTFTSATRAGLHFKSKAHTILKYANSGEIF
jgi:group I intron endonuclease